MHSMQESIQIATWNSVRHDFFHADISKTTSRINVVVQRAKDIHPEIE